MAFVVVSTALAMNNTVGAVCGDLETLLQSLSKAMRVVVSDDGLFFVTNATAFNDVPCVENVCPQCGGNGNSSNSVVGGRRRLLGSGGGVNLATVSTSISPVLVSAASTQTPPPLPMEELQSALAVSLATAASDLAPAGIVATVSTVLVQLPPEEVVVVPRLVIPRDKTVEWMNGGFALGCVFVVFLVSFVWVG
jgi:hypothetical protein